jgi:hypothetical protein
MVLPVLEDANRPANGHELSGSCNEFCGGEVKESESEAGERVLCTINNENYTRAQSGRVAS